MATTANARQQWMEVVRGAVEESRDQLMRLGEMGDVGKAEVEMTTRHWADAWPGGAGALSINRESFPATR
jgi:hypothetical protein